MRTVFSSWARDAEGDLKRAEGTLVFAVLAVSVPALLGWLLESVAGSPGSGRQAETFIPVLFALAALVRWIGLGVLTLVVPVYLGLSIAQHRRAHGCAPELSAWALAEVYLASAVVALVGFFLLT